MFVALSDLHLTNRFDPRKFHALMRVLQPVDRAAVAGDLWDSRRCTFDQFVRSPWRNLFPILKDRRAVYLFGNHDPEEAADERVGLFSVRQGWEAEVEIGGWRLRLEHGHRIYPDPVEAKYPWILKIPAIGHLDYAVTEVLLTRLFGERWIDYRGRPCVRRLKERARELAPTGRWLVCGHSHVAELDPGIRYANCGFIGLGRIQYLRIAENGIGVVRSYY